MRATSSREAWRAQVLPTVRATHHRRPIVPFAIVPFRAGAIGRDALREKLAPTRLRVGESLLGTHNLLDSFVIPWLDVRTPFPPLDTALIEPNGLLAAGADLSAPRLIDAYRRGIYPWYSEGQPVLWWSPDPRMVLFVDEFRTSRSLSRRVRRGEFEIRCDTAFDAVIEACASSPREGQRGTWITKGMMSAYRRLHDLGYGHSVEAWRADELVGGLYGVALGGVFFGESMFTRATDASKVCLAALVALLQQRGTRLIDCQQETEHLASMGARPIPRDEFARALGELINSNAPPRGWQRGPLPEYG